MPRDKEKKNAKLRKSVPILRDKKMPRLQPGSLKRVIYQSDQRELWTTSLFEELHMTCFRRENGLCIKEKEVVFNRVNDDIDINKLNQHETVALYQKIIHQDGYMPRIDNVYVILKNNHIFAYKIRITDELDICRTIYFARK